MASLTVRDLDDTIKARLRVRAAQHGRSMEAEVRAILRSVLIGPEPAGGLGSWIQRSFAGIAGPAVPVPARTDPPRVPELPE